MASGLDVQKRPRRSYLGCDTAELELECFRVAHRYGGSLLLPAGIGKRDEFVQRPLGNTRGDSTV